MKTVKNILSYILKEKFITIILIIINLLSYLYKFVTYRELTEYISIIEENKDNNTFIDLSLFFIKLLITHFIHSITYYNLDKLVTNNIKNIFTSIINKVLLYNIEFFEKVKKDKFIEIWKYTDSMSFTIRNIIIDIPRILLYLCYYTYTIYCFSSYAILSVFITITIIIKSIHPLEKKQYSYHNNRTKLEFKTKQRLLDIINNIVHVKLYQQEKNETDNITSIYNKYHEFKIKDSKIELLKNILTETIGDLIYIIIYFVSASHIITGKMKAIEVLYLAAHTSSFYLQIVNIKTIYNSYQRHKPKIKLLFDIIEYDTYEKYDGLCNIPNLSYGKIEFDNISFKYLNKKDNIFDNFNNSIKLGDINIIAGKNGCGKSTLISLLLKFYKPTKGNIRINNIDINNISINSIRNNISLVLQHNSIFNDTVWNNITYGLDNYTEDIIYEVANNLNMKKWVENNINKIAGKYGEHLSGGERKKLQLLNAILHNKQILILDEPTNGLDIKTVEWLINTIKLLYEKYKKTIIIITHDQRLLQLTQNITFLSDI